MLMFMLVYLCNHITVWPWERKFTMWPHTERKSHKQKTIYRTAILLIKKYIYTTFRNEHHGFSTMNIKMWSWSIRKILGLSCLACTSKLVAIDLLWTGKRFCPVGCQGIEEALQERKCSNIYPSALSFYLPTVIKIYAKFLEIIELVKIQ